MIDVARHRIAPGDWRTFCERWGRSHRGWLVTVSVGSPDGRALVQARTLRGVGLSADGVLSILVDGPVPETLAVAGVTEIFERFADGAHAGLQLARAAEPAIFVSFRTPALPEMLDGIAESER